MELQIIIMNGNVRRGASIITSMIPVYFNIISKFQYNYRCRNVYCKSSRDQMVYLARECETEVLTRILL